MLILFDIDATLIKTSGLGIKAMGLAGRELFGEAFNEHLVEYAGRLDPLIISDLLKAHAIDEIGPHVTRFRAGYRRHLETLLSTPGTGKACPGVPELLAHLRENPNLTLGLLTGNFPETGRIKLRACGIDTDLFTINAWGDESPHLVPARDHLPPIAIARYNRLKGATINPRHVTIIGDTPHDIACAKAHNCRALAVATGQFSLDALNTCAPDHAVPDLSNTKEIAHWLQA